MALGATLQMPTSDKHLVTRTELETKLRVLLGGYAAERLVLGEISSGSENDLQRATEIAHRMVSHFGMSDKVGPVYHEQAVTEATQTLQNSRSVSELLIETPLDLETLERGQLDTIFQQARPSGRRLGAAVAAV